MQIRWNCPERRIIEIVSQDIEERVRSHKVFHFCSESSEYEQRNVIASKVNKPF